MNLSSCLKFIWKVTLEESKEAATPCCPTRPSTSPHRRRVLLCGPPPPAFDLTYPPRRRAHHTTRAAETARLSDRGSGARCSCRRQRRRCSTSGLPARVEVKAKMPSSQHRSPAPVSPTTRHQGTGGWTVNEIPSTPGQHLTPTHCAGALSSSAGSAASPASPLAAAGHP